jgi:hypothetical protein
VLRKAEAATTPGRYARSWSSLPGSRLGGEGNRRVEQHRPRTVGALYKRAWDKRVAPRYRSVSTLLSVSQRASPARQSRIPIRSVLVGYLRRMSERWAALSPLQQCAYVRDRVGIAFQAVRILFGLQFNLQPDAVRNPDRSLAAIFRLEREISWGRQGPTHSGTDGSQDSPLERNGFELPVPRENGYRSESSGFVYHNFGMRAAPTSAIQVRI